jgi:hypothetical protein
MEYNLGDIVVHKVMGCRGEVMGIVYSTGQVLVDWNDSELPSGVAWSTSIRKWENGLKEAKTRHNL